MTKKKEVRCPHGPRSLLAKVVEDGDSKRYVDDGRLVELFCKTCTRSYRESDKTVMRVLHRFNIIGELVNTSVERKPLK